MKVCKYCDTELPLDKQKNTFCNSSCAASHNNQGVRRNYSEDRHRLNKCLFCDEDTHNPKFCSNPCQWKYRRDVKFAEMEKTGVLDSDSWGKITSCGRKYLIHLRGHKCETCLNDTWLECPIALDIHHINSDSDDNRIENTQLLCLNCHSCTPGFRGKNRTGNGRWSKRNIIRRKRYAEGKSS